MGMYGMPRSAHAVLHHTSIQNGCKDHRLAVILTESADRDLTQGAVWLGSGKPVESRAAVTGSKAAAPPPRTLATLPDPLPRPTRLPTHGAALQLPVLQW